MDLLGWNTEYGPFVATTCTIAGVFLGVFGLFWNAWEKRQANQNMRTEMRYMIIHDLTSEEDTARVLDPEADASQISLKETYGAIALLLNLSSSFRASRYRLYRLPQKIDADVLQLLSLPILGAVWAKQKQYYNEDFVRFVERSLARATKS